MTQRLAEQKAAAVKRQRFKGQSKGFALMATDTAPHAAAGR